MLTRFMLDESGQGLVEYALIIALVAGAAVVAIQKLGHGVNSTITGTAKYLS